MWQSGANLGSRVKESGAAGGCGWTEGLGQEMMVSGTAGELSADIDRFTRWRHSVWCFRAPGGGPPVRSWHHSGALCPPTASPARAILPHVGARAEGLSRIQQEQRPAHVMTLQGGRTQVIGSACASRSPRRPRSPKRSSSVWKPQPARRG